MYGVHSCVKRDHNLFCYSQFPKRTRRSRALSMLCKSLFRVFHTNTETERWEVWSRPPSWVWKRGHHAPRCETSNRFAFFPICYTFSLSSPAIMTLYWGAFVRWRKCLFPIKAKTYSPHWNSPSLVFKCSLFEEGGCGTRYFSWGIIDDAVGLDILVMNISINRHISVERLKR